MTTFLSLYPAKTDKKDIICVSRALLCILE